MISKYSRISNEAYLEVAYLATAKLYESIVRELEKSGFIDKVYR